MSTAAKLIILILFLLLGSSVFFVLTILNQKQTLEKTNHSLEDRAKQSETRELKVMGEKKIVEETLQTLETEKTKIEKDLEEANSKVDGFNKQVADLNSQLSKLSQDRDDVKGRLESLRKERDDLMTKFEDKPKFIEKESASSETTDQDKTASSAPPKGVQGDDYWAGVLKEKAALEVRLSDLKGQLSTNMVTTAELKKQSSDLEMELGTLKNEKTDLERKVKYNEDLANNLSLELARTRNDRKSGDEQLNGLREESESLRSQIKALSSAKMSLEKNIARLVEDKNSLTSKLDENENMILAKMTEILQIKSSIDKQFQGSQAQSKQAELKPMIDELLAMKGKIDKKYPTERSDTKEVQLQPIIVNAAGPVVDQAPEGNEHGPGHILSVNELNNFVVVDLGENSGIKTGDRLSVYRDTRYVAGLEIIEVRKDISAADIRDKNSRIQAGDEVQ